MGRTGAAGGGVCVRRRSQGRARATDLFAGFNGILQVDGYAGYNGLLDPVRPGGPVTFAFCFAHSRRKFYDVHVATGSPIAAEAVRRIGEFYAIEDRIRGKSAGIRCAVRQAETKPLLDDFKLWLDARLGEVSQKSGLAEAIRYALSHWEGLTRFLSDGCIEIDSNTVERTMRPIALGRRNYLFAGSNEGGRTWWRSSRRSLGSPGRRSIAAPRVDSIPSTCDRKDRLSVPRPGATRMACDSGKFSTRIPAHFSAFPESAGEN